MVANQGSAAPPPVPQVAERLRCFAESGREKMKYALRLALIIGFALAAAGSNSKAADGCISYGDEKTDFTWRLCPAGEKYERRYLYFGFWSDFYRVPDDTGACHWSASKSSWLCRDKAIRCNAGRCSS
jgi:hypothetical protein